MVRRRTRNKRSKPKIEWDVPRAERSKGRASRARGTATYTGSQSREDFKSERSRTAVWESTKDKLTGGVKQLPPYVSTDGLTRELEAALVPGRMLFLKESVELADEGLGRYDEHVGKNMPVPLVVRHQSRKYDKNYDPAKEIHMPKGGMIVYVGHEIVDALAGNKQKGATVRMDVYKFLINDGIYMIINMNLVMLPS